MKKEVIEQLAIAHIQLAAAWAEIARVYLLDGDSNFSVMAAQDAAKHAYNRSLALAREALQYDEKAQRPTKVEPSLLDQFPLDDAVFYDENKLKYNAEIEHDFSDEFGSCKGCGKYVKQLIDERYCSGRGENNSK